MKTEQEKMYLTTGDIAKQLHISVRTIRYYDQIGLVQPSLKTESGKRLYSDEDILSLQKILLLKSLNLSLEDSRSILAEQSMSSILKVHKSLLEREVTNLNQSLKHTQTLLNLSNLEGKVKWEDLISLVVSVREENDWNHYFSTEQENILKSKIPKLENESLNTKRWINLIKRIEHCLEKKVSPNSLESQLILEDVNIFSQETFGENPELAEAFWEVRKSAKASEELGLYPIEPAVIEFLEKAGISEKL